MPMSNADIKQELPVSKEDVCSHEFHYLRLEYREVVPHKYHGDVQRYDIFYCIKCLKYRDVQGPALTYEQYVLDRSTCDVSCVMKKV